MRCFDWMGYPWHMDSLRYKLAVGVFIAGMQICSCSNLRFFLEGFRKPCHLNAIPERQAVLNPFLLGVDIVCKVISYGELIPDLFLGWDKTDAFLADFCVYACFIEKICGENFTNKFSISLSTDDLVSSRIDGNLILPASLNGLIDSL